MTTISNNLLNYIKATIQNGDTTTQVTAPNSTTPSMMPNDIVDVDVSSDIDYIAKGVDAWLKELKEKGSFEFATFYKGTSKQENMDRLLKLNYGKDAASKIESTVAAPADPLDINELIANDNQVEGVAHHVTDKGVFNIYHVVTQDGNELYFSQTDNMRAPMFWLKTEFGLMQIKDGEGQALIGAKKG